MHPQKRGDGRKNAGTVDSLIRTKWHRRYEGIPPLSPPRLLSDDERRRMLAVIRVQRTCRCGRETVYVVCDRALCEVCHGAQ